ncbi:deadenylation complex subunit pan3 [Holotrichia oblita]|uniref:Cysteine-rich secretory protein-related n=2 Tax=Holotrichia oblita TaxID=644536 RepID=A0ACB9TTC6_HOLOL|nr:cysteine-rich secretory protein-related [Holotrichia oblita]KAI4470840.1 deadenylation complex subunit pan3 [Holotrichia oblita]
MSSISDYHNPSFYNPEFGDFSRFYIVIAVITTIGTLLFLLNLVLGCCSQHTYYWGDRHTGMKNLKPHINDYILYFIGNRWIVSLWTATPHNQSALDYTELEHHIVPHSVVVDSPKHPFEYSNVEFQHHPVQPEIPVEPEVPAQYIEMKKRESDI